MLICAEPFEKIETDYDGSVYFCCAHHAYSKVNTDNCFSIGNIFENSFEEIWNSEKAIEIRTKILNNDYSLCANCNCIGLHNHNEHFKEQSYLYQPVMEQSPIGVKLSHDEECNVNCIFCRNEIQRNSEEKMKKYDKLIDSLFIPLLKDTQFINPNISGDVFASRHSRKLVKAIIEKYPNIKFEILTNGVLATNNMLNELNLLEGGKIRNLAISIHAVTKETYNKIVRNGNYDMLMKNIENITELRNKGLIRGLTFNFVVNSYNYKELADFARFAMDHNAYVCFWEIRDYKSELSTHYKELAVHLPEHPEHNKLIEVLQDDIFDYMINNHIGEMNPVLANLRRK